MRLDPGLRGDDDADSDRFAMREWTLRTRAISDGPLPTFVIPAHA